jgi:TonB family protein
MTVPRTQLFLMASVVWLGGVAGVGAQETLARAKELYNLASYDDALVMLSRLHQTAAAAEFNEISGYQVFCLLALGRTDEARQAIATLARNDPMYRPPEATTSPRTRAVFDEVRRGLLPGIVQDTYDKAKAAFDRKESQAALDGFDRVLALLDEPGLSGMQSMGDLRRLATGFRDLAKADVVTAASVTANTGPPEAPTPVAPLATVASPAATPPAYGPEDKGVLPPVVLARPMPAWQPRNDIDKRRVFQGVIEVLVDEKGDVVSVALGKSVHLLYDKDLLEIARKWKFKPATKDGVPVRYRRTFEIRLGPPGTPQQTLDR